MTVQPAPNASFRIRVAAATDVGRARQSNEDAYLVAATGASAAESGGEATFDSATQSVILAVSDGMGGAAAGEVASALVVEVLQRSLPADSPDWTSALRQAVQAANREVWQAGQLPSRRGMGATLTAVCVNGRDAYLAEVGDSRAYLLRGGVLRLLTHDQSYVQMLVDAGALTADQAENSPMKNIISSAMGQDADVSVDLGRVELMPGDALLVCSDGLSNEVSAADIRDILTHEAAPDMARSRLIAMANEHGGRDNVTVVVARFESPIPDEIR